MTAGHFDARALVEPVDQTAVDADARAHRAANPTPGSHIAAWAVAIVALVMVVPILGILLLGLGYALGRGTGVAIAGLLGLLVLTGAIVGVVALVRRARRLRALARFRLSRFAAANAMTYLDRIDAPPLPGMIFQEGSGRISTDVLRGTAPRFVEFGNYQYTTSNGKSSQTHRWGYVAVKLDVPLPNIVLDALGNNGLGGSIATGFRRDQRLSLEGDFDRYFELFCPEGYEEDALYLFTPDVMARFIDHAAELDVEIVDDWLFLYTRRAASTLDPATWAWLFGAVGALLAKLEQWARWRDERLRLSAGIAQPAAAPATGRPAPSFAALSPLITPPPVGVAPPGQRLRRRSPWVVIGIVLGALLLIGLAPVAVGVIGVLFVP